MRTIIAPTTSAETKLIRVDSDEYVSVAQYGLEGTEKITFEIDMDGWKPVLPELALYSNENYVQIAGPNTYRINKPVTVSPTGVYFSE